MKKKVFSLMMTLVLAFMGVARAQEVTVYDGTVTNNYVPAYVFYFDDFTRSQYVIPAADLAEMSGGTVSSVKFYTTNSNVPYTSLSTVDVYLKEVDYTTISAFEAKANCQVVYSGTLEFVAEGTGGTCTITFSTPFTYNGGNLLVGIENTTDAGYKNIYFYGQTVTGASVAGYNSSSLDNVTATQRNFLPKTTFAYAGGGGASNGLPHVLSNGVLVDAIDLGVRPGYVNATVSPNWQGPAWMQPAKVQMYNDNNRPYTVSVLDFTPNDSLFLVLDAELPFTLAANAQDTMDLNVTLRATEAVNGTTLERQFVAIYENSRLAAVWPITAEVYSPECPDIWELALNLHPNQMPVTNQPLYESTLTGGHLHNDYDLPFDEIEEGYDAVYKLTIENDVKLNAYVLDNYANGKVALYTEDFYGEGGPMAHNYYQGIGLGGGSTAAPFEAQIGEGTNTLTYFPFHSLWNYSLAENLFLASELNEAGVTTSPMTSLSWYVSSTSCTTPQNNISIWMANVSDEVLTSTSHTTAGMTLVYTGSNILPVAGEWNEFVFNEGSFAWDGHSNVLILCQRNNGAWQGSISWQTHNPGFAATCYAYSDTNGGFDAANQTYSMSTSSTNRANIIMKGGNGRESFASRIDDISFGPVIENLPLTPGNYYLVASSTDEDFEVYINVEDMPCPQVEGFAFGPTPADDTDDVEPASVTLRWNIPNYATGWRLIFGSTYHPEANHPQTVMYPADGSFTNEMANSYTVTNLWNNTNYFWRVEFNNTNCPDGVSSPVWGFTTHLNIPSNLQANDYTIFDDETVTLTWNGVVDRTFRTYFIYRDGVKVGETTTNSIESTSFIDGPLAYNMDGYVYYVTAIYDEGESDPCDPITVKVSGYSNETGINGYAYEQDGETPIPGVLVTLTGTDEFGDPHTYTATTNNNGYYSKQVYAGEYTNAVATIDGYQETVTTHPLPFTVAYDTQEDNVNFILDENFDPVCQVIAEYYPDSLDPASPYVKVYWGCGFTPDAIIEPFETGDFSLFDWQVSSNYPWVITTENPYEGQYCMKSGNQQVLSSTSTMQVTVEIPADGEMSFFGKISCEQSWDYGYFYIDGQQMGSYTGNGNWAERKFPITAGEHTFKWEYTEDFLFSEYDDCFYVDYITFYRQPEPVQPGWVFYDDGVNVDAIGLTAGGSFYWGVMFPAGQYAGNTVSKVSMFDYAAHTGNIIICQGGTTAPGTQLYTQAYTCTGSQDFVEWTLTNPVSIDPTQPLWIVMNNNNGQYVASACANTGNPNGRWISLDGNTWEDVAGYGLDYTWMIRAYVANGAKGEYVASTTTAVPQLAQMHQFAKGESIVSPFATSGNTNAQAVSATGNIRNTRSLNHYRVYRTNCYNEGPYTEENTVLLATVWVPDTVYIDVEWADLAPGVYKWGVGAVYAGNRGELVESEITWTEPVNVEPVRAEMDNRDMTFDFEDGQVPAGWVNDATYPWVATTSAYAGFNGSYCLMSGNSGVSGSTSTLETTATFVHEGTVSFLAGCWGEGTNDSYDWDKCRFYIDGTLMFDYGAHQAWESVSYPVGAGQHTFTWTYKKDNSVNPTGDVFFIDDVTFVGTSGSGNGSNALALPRESETVWSNCLDKDMWLEGLVSVTVLLNSADSPEGAVVSFRNENEYEEAMYPMGSVTLDESGYYVWDSFRRGDYEVTVSLDGYETIVDNVSIWAPTDLRYVMIEILYPMVSDIYVSRTGWAMWDGPYMPDGTNPNPQGNDSFFEDFEGGFNGWTSIDADGDGLNWVHSSNSINASGYDYTGLGHNGSDGFVYSQSFIDYDGAYNANNYLISPVKYSINNGSTLNFWADNANDSYPDNFEVCVATVDNPTPADFTMVWSHSGAKGGDKAATRFNGDRYENWRSHSVDLSTYAGQNVWIAFHHQDYDEYEIWIDDVQLTSGREDRHFEYYKVMCTSIDGVPIYNHNTVWPWCQLSTNEPYNAPLIEGDHYLVKVAVMYSTGLSAWSEPVEWVYEPCDHWGPIDELEVTTPSEGNHLEWVFEHGINPYDPGDGPGGGEGSTFDFGFEEGMPAGWTVIDANNDGYTWTMTSDIPSTWTYYAGMTLDWYRSGSNAICSGSYINGVGALTPDEYLVSPQVTLANGSTFSFWAAATDAGYPADHFGVFVSDNGTSDWTEVQSWTLTAKGGAKSGNPAAMRDGRAASLGTWYNYSVDLSAYAGQKYIAIRHYGCTDQYIMCVDDIQLNAGAKGGYSFDKGGEFYTQYAEDGVLLNFFAMDNFDLRSFMLYTLSTDSRFSLVPEDEYGKFVLTSRDDDSHFMSEFETAYQNAIADFSLMTKNDIAEHAATWKTSVSANNYASIMMDMYTNSIRVENDHCINSLPFCTSDFYEFESAYSGQTADELEGTNLQDGCIGSSYNPSWYHMRIREGGQFVIHLEGHDPDNGAERDVDFCIWGPFTDPYTPCVAELTTSKIIDCSYSASYNEDIYLGYPEEQHDHGYASHGTVNYHVPEAGEYYILMLTNYSNQPCVVTFTKSEGEGETDCDIVEPTADILGFLITQDGEYLDIVGPNVREYTDLGEFGDHEYCVRPIYPGLANMPEQNYYFSMGCPVCEFSNGEAPIEECAPVANLSGMYMNYEGIEGLVIDWEDPEGATSIKLYVEGELLGELPAGTHPIFLGFAGEVPEYTFTIGAVAVHPDCESDMVETQVYYDDVNENSIVTALFPNPTTGNVTIQAMGMNHITVVNAIGQVVYDIDLRADEYTLDMGQFNAGLYLVRIATVNGVTTKRVTVVK